MTQIGNTQLNFGQAIELVKKGKCVQRSGWNGKGMFIFARPEDVIPVKTVIENIKSLPDSVKQFYKTRTEGATENIGVKFTAYLCMKAADDSIVNGWLASQTDMLAEDWVEFGFLPEYDIAKEE